MRVAVISDVHSNRLALEAVLAALGSVDALWQLGDVVGYGPEPGAVVDLLRAAGAAGVRGNHDAAVLGDVSTEDFNLAASTAVEWTRYRIDGPCREYLAALPERLEIVPPGREGSLGPGWTIAHGSPRDPIWEYLTESWQARDNLAHFETRFCLIGHSHLPLAFLERGGHVKGGSLPRGRRIELGSGRAFLNPGSVGQPRDGDPRAAYMTVDTDRGLATWHRVEYDVAATQAAMVRAGLPASLVRRLSSGR